MRAYRVAALLDSWRRTQFPGEPTPLRFDDMLSTALRLPDDDPASLARKWRQLADLLAQPHRADEAPAAAEQALRFLRGAREAVPAVVRAETLAALTELPVSSALAELAMRENGAAAARAEGAEPDGAVVPAAAPTPEPIGAEDEAPATSQVADLLARVEHMRRRRDLERAADAGPPAPAPAADEAFRWRAGRDGVIQWVSARARGALIGLSIAEAQGGAPFGVDGHAAGAFRRRTAFRDARLVVPGRSPMAGDWRITAQPVFDEEDGRFAGFHGVAARPRLDQVAPAAAAPLADRADDGPFASPIPADGLRPLVHELRTPLNAIVGFSEMIEGQHLGPADRAQRARAAMIRAQAGRLIGAIEDLDTAARLDRGQVAHGGNAVDVAPLLRELHRRYAGLAEERGARLLLDGEPGVSLVDGDAGDLERMIGRLLAAVVGIAGYGERLRLKLVDAGAERIRLEVERPALIDTADERELLDPGYAPDGASPAAPLLGLGFALRLVRHLAAAIGGRFDVEKRRLTLTLPRAAAEREATG